MVNILDTKNKNATIKCWVDLYSDHLFSWALYKISDKEIAEDLVQETFLAAVQSYNNFGGKSTPKTWLFAILNNKIADHHRASFSKPATLDLSSVQGFFDVDGQWLEKERPMQWLGDTEHLLDNSEFQKTLSSCLSKLPESWRFAMQLKYLDGKKGELICQELDISPTNFWQILHRAKLQLRKCLEINWFKKN